jgi:integrase
VKYAFRYIDSPSTRKNYTHNLEVFLNHIGMSGNDIEEKAQALLTKAKSTKKNPYWLEDTIMDYIQFLRGRHQKGELSSASPGAYYYPIEAFCKPYKRELPVIDWEMLKGALPPAKSHANDRAPTTDEICIWVKFPDRRIKPLLYVMASSGIRVGAWKGLCWKHVEAQTNDKGEVIAAQLTVYNEDGDQYFTFMTPEAYNTLKEYMDWRRSIGEEITGNSPLIRDKPQTVDVVVVGTLQGNKDNNRPGLVGLDTIAKPVTISDIRKQLNRALKAQGLRYSLPEGKRRYEFQLAHGLRKYFYTHAKEGGMTHDQVEYLAGHRSGNQASYYRPNRKRELLQAYIKAVPALTIEYDSSSSGKAAAFEKQLIQLEEKGKEHREDSHIILGKLAQKEKEIEEMKAKAEETRKDLEIVKTSLAEGFAKQLEQFQEDMKKRYDKMFHEMLYGHSAQAKMIRDVFVRGKDLDDDFLHAMAEPRLGKRKEQEKENTT